MCCWLVLHLGLDELGNWSQKIPSHTVWLMTKAILETSVYPQLLTSTSHSITSAPCRLHRGLNGPLALCGLPLGFGGWKALAGMEKESMALTPIVPSLQSGDWLLLKVLVPATFGRGSSSFLSPLKGSVGFLMLRSGYFPVPHCYLITPDPNCINNTFTNLSSLVSFRGSSISSLLPNCSSSNGSFSIEKYYR